MVGAHDSRLVSPWHLRVKRRAIVAWAWHTLMRAVGLYSALGKGALSTTAAHRLAYLTVDKADDLGVGELLPARVVPVVSV